MTARVYPVFLRLDGEPVVVVGGGPVAAGKLAGLCAAGARVTVIAPAIGDACREAIASARSDGAAIDRGRSEGAEIDRGRSEVAVIERAFAPADLDGARFAIAAATPEVNREVAAAARARNLFVNAVDDPAVATAFLGGVVRRGELTVAVSTGGAAPALAGLLREALDATLPADLDAWLATARARRARWREDGTPMPQRRDDLLDALIASRAAGARS